MELISRERLIDELVKIAKTSESDWRGIKFSAREIKFLIELQKTIESRPKGKWEMMRDENTGAIGGECSNCNKWTLYAVSYDLDSNKHSFDYCPKCGAEMI